MAGPRESHHRLQPAEGKVPAEKGQQGRAVASGREPAMQVVTVLMGVVVALSFMFGFGNVLALGIRLGAPVYVAPLIVAPAADLSVVALLVGTREFAVRGASAEQIRPARRLLMFSSVVTMALNIAEPLIAGQYGKAAFDSVGSFCFCYRVAVPQGDWTYGPYRPTNSLLVAALQTQPLPHMASAETRSVVLCLSAFCSQSTCLV